MFKTLLVAYLGHEIVHRSPLPGLPQQTLGSVRTSLNKWPKNIRVRSYDIVAARTSRAGWGSSSLSEAPGLTSLNTSPKI